MTWKIKARQADGSVSETFSDDAKHALDVLAHHRADGLEAWVEDTEGRRVDENSLSSAV